MWLKCGSDSDDDLTQTIRWLNQDPLVSLSLKKAVEIPSAFVTLYRWMFFNLESPFPGHCLKLNIPAMPEKFTSNVPLHMGYW